MPQDSGWARGGKHRPRIALVGDAALLVDGVCAMGALFLVDALAGIMCPGGDAEFESEGRP